GLRAPRVNRALRLGMSLRTRLTLWYGALLALALLGFSAFLYLLLQQSLANSVDQRLTVRADQIRREVSASIGSSLQPQDVRSRPKASPRDGWIGPPARSWARASTPNPWTAAGASLPPRQTWLAASCRCRSRAARRSLPTSAVSTRCPWPRATRMCAC